MKHRKIIRLLVIPAALFVILLIVLVMCRRSAICGGKHTATEQITQKRSATAYPPTAKPYRISLSLPYSAAYTKLQRPAKKQCGFDLSLYKGEDAVQYTYIITDYTDDSGNTLDNIRMNLIIVSGRIVGGDICSAALDGFMTGLQPRKN